MSYHILHQFDEQWLADVMRDENESKGLSLIASADDERQTARRSNIAAREINRWIVAIAILIASFALLFALDANRRADSLQHRLDALESQAKK